MKETLNLLPSAKRDAKRRGPAFYASLLIAAYLITLSGLYAHNRSLTKKLSAQISEVEKKNADLRTALASVPEVGVQIALVPSELMAEKEIADRVASARAWSAMLAELSVIVPEKIWLGQIEAVQPGTVGIKGFSKGQTAVAEFVGSLSASRHFEGVEIVYSQQGDKDVAFELKARAK